MAEAKLITLGCRLNTFESEVMRGHATAAGLADAIIVNTCAVTAEAERQARQAIRKAKRENPRAKIIVTGCAAQIAPEKFAALPEVDHVLGNSEKLEAKSFQRIADGGVNARVEVSDIMLVKETAAHLISGFAERSRAFVEIQQGCDHRCTFCIIPFGRGNNRSVPVGEVVARARRLVENGFREIVLTGVDITGYGADLPGVPKLGQLVRRLLALVPELERLRLSSLDVIEVDDELLRLIAEEPRLMPHLHLSLQAGDDMVLKRMKRRHLRADAVKFAEDVRRLRPDVVFGADLIAGFPTEDEAMFRNSLALVEDCGLTFLHVFPYSARSGTPAAKMPQVLGNVRKERAARLRAAGQGAMQRYFADRIGSPVSVLIERAEDGVGFGHSEHFAPVCLKSDRMRSAAAIGTVITGRVAGHTEDHLVAEAA
jgi:threonylcarbamoyladenosine tRNA methylthiotransferase MtaB